MAQDQDVIYQAFVAARDSGDADNARRFAQMLVESEPTSSPTGGLEFRPFGIDTGVQMPEGVSEFMAGAGKGFVDIGRGLGQILGISDAEEIAESRRLDAPLMESGAGVAGNVTSQILSALGPGSALRGLGAAGRALGLTRAGDVATKAGTALFNPATARAAIGSGAALGAVQPTVGDESRATGAALGALGGGIGHGVGSAIGRVIRPTRSPLSPEDQRMADMLQERGVQLDALDLTESKPLKVLEGVFEQFPLTAGRAQARAETRDKAFTRAALRTIGVDADEVTDDVIDTARRQIGAEFDALAIGGAGDSIVPAGVQVPDEMLQAPIFIDDEFISTIRRLSEAGELMPESLRTRGVAGIFKDFLGPEEALKEGARPAITAKQYQAISSQLAKRARDVKGKNTALHDDLLNVREALDSMVERNLGGEKLARWRDARRKWRNMLVIEDAVESTQGGIQDRLINAKRLRSSAKRVGKEKLLGGGKTELTELAKAGMKFANLSPDSYTAQRQMMQNLITGGVLGGGAGYVAGADPQTLLGTALLGAGAPIAAQRALYSPAMRNYISQGLVPQGLEQLGQAGRAALTRAGTPLIGAFGPQQQ